MDILVEAADFYRKLTNSEYKFEIAYKGQIKTITFIAKDENFPHLIGLDKLKDINTKVFVDDRKAKDKRGNTKANKNIAKERVLGRVEERKLTIEDLSKSSHFDLKQDSKEFSVKDRMKYFLYLKKFFDSTSGIENPEEVYFSFYKKQAYSSIDAEYLIRLIIVDNEVKVYLNFFIKEDMYSENEVKYIPISFFPRTDDKYEKMQKRWTLLYKSKYCKVCGKFMVLFQKAEKQ